MDSISFGHSLRLLSAVVITLNSAATLKRCLESLSFADEVIVLDGGSSDQTQAVARECGARLLENSDWQGFGIQKNRALDLASHEWILLLDSDEWLEASAVQEIRDVVVSSGNANLNDSRDAAAGSVPQATTAPQAYRLRRRSRYLGRIVRHSGWWPDHVTRLFAAMQPVIPRIGCTNDSCFASLIGSERSRPSLSTMP